MTTMRARTRALQGEAVRWDGTNAAALKILAGESFEGIYESCALVRNLDGDLVYVRPGWVVSRWDGQVGVGISSPAAWAASTEECP